MLFHSLLIYIKLKTVSFLRHYASSSFPGRAAREKRFFLPYNASLPLSPRNQKNPNTAQTHGPPRDEKIEGISLPLCYN